MRWTLILPCLLACGGQTEGGADASGDTTVADAVNEAPNTPDASIDGGGPSDASSEKQWPIVYDIVDGGGDGPDCYPDGSIEQACCNGQPCRGFCVLDDDGSIECSCYGIPEGCTGWANTQQTIPNVCCSKYRGCIDLYSCLPMQK